MLPRVLFVSKAIVPPFHDGSKCLVRDVASNLKQTSAIIMTTGEPCSDPALSRLTHARVYRGRGGFAPSLRDNAGVASHLLLGRNIDLWHFVMAPNPRTCQIGRWLKAVRRMPVVQTVASQPRSFTNIATLLFGDVIVAQSTWTRERIIDAARNESVAVDVEMIPPPLSPLDPPSGERRAAIRERFALSHDAKILLYPGDLEVSHGAEIVAGLVEPIARQIPEAVFVFACREKTPRAPEIKQRLMDRLPAGRVRFVGEVEDFRALLASAWVVLFPVDDLWGKVDLPIALLEALALEIPVLALAAGPLLDLAEGAELLATTQAHDWVTAIVELLRNAEKRAALGEKGRLFVEERHAANRIAAAYERVYERLLQTK
jgi:phosphatidylinositol alpha-1,6-mannosyltransferase